MRENLIREYDHLDPSLRHYVQSNLFFGESLFLEGRYAHDLEVTIFVPWDNLRLNGSDLILAIRILK